MVCDNGYHTTWNRIHFTILTYSTGQGIVSAPLWDSFTSTYAGLLTVNDYLNVVRYYNLHADKLKDVDKLLLSDLKGEQQISPLLLQQTCPLYSKRQPSRCN